VTRRFPLCALTAALLLAGCSGPRDSQVAADLAKLHPDCELQDTSHGKLQDQKMWVGAFYTCGSNPEKQEMLFRYQKTEDGWTLIHPRKAD